MIRNRIPLIIIFVTSFLVASTAIGALMSIKVAAAPNEDGRALRRVEVWLVEPVTKVVGKAWPRLDNGEPQALTAIEEPVMMVVHLPGGRVIESFSFGVFMEAQDGLVSEVILQPLAKLVGHLEVTDDAEKFVLDWKVGNDEILNKLRNWRSRYSSDPVLIPYEQRQPNPEMTQHAASEIEPGVTLNATRGIIRDSDHKEGWYLRISFSANKAVDRKMGRKPVGER